MRPLPTTAWLLGFGGVMPFLLLFLALLMKFDLPGVAAVDVADWLLVYAAVIISFIGAVHWGVALAWSEQLSPTDALKHYLYGVIPALLAWTALLLPAPMALFVLAGIVMLAYGADAVLLFRRLNSDYSILRLYLTSAVSLLLVASGLTLMLEV